MTWETGLTYTPCWAGLSLSVVSNSETPWTVAHQAPLSMGILQARIQVWAVTPFSIYTLICTKCITDKNLMYGSGNPTPCSMVT